ncbi:MAG: hypothetical protein OXC19_12115 [Bryobacterales bacterium]|nr:hypothetical protein [Bryobacterales bacterium]
MTETSRALLRAVGTVALLCCLMTPVRAEPGPVGKWLMTEPLTLWDHGMMNMERDAKQAAERIKTGGDQWAAWALYDWDNNEIEINLINLDFHGAISHETCNETRRSFMTTLFKLYGTTDKKAVTEFMHTRVNWWFSHEGFTNKSRDAKLGEKLTRIIFVAVRLQNDDGGIMCRDRVTTLDAPSKPL